MLTLPDAKPHFDKLVAMFEKYSKLVNKEVIQGEEMAAKFIELSGTKEDKDEFKHILKALKKFEKQHLVFEDHFRESLVLVKVGNLVEARKMFQVIEHEEEILNHELEDLLAEIEQFTVKSAQKAKAHEESAVQMVSIAAIVGVIIALLSA